MKVYSHSLQGKRPTQEDNHFSFININNNNHQYNPLNIFCVFDGHGGSCVSKYLKKNLPDFFRTKLNQDIYNNKKNFINYINEVYNYLQDNLKTKHPRAVEYCGSTACTAINYHKNNDNLLWLINVGDSRAILCDKDNNAVTLTVDHKPNEINEKIRIKNLGGKIIYDGSDWRIKTLSLSRAFGDLDCSPYVIHTPSIIVHKIKKDKFLIIACDGLWDALSNQEAVNFILLLESNNFNGNYAQEIAEYALKKGSQDNITVIVYFF